MKKLIAYTAILVSAVLLFTILLNQNTQPSPMTEETSDIPSVINEQDDDFEKTPCIQMIEDIVIVNPQEECLYIDMQYYYKPPSVIITNNCGLPMSVEGTVYDERIVELNFEVGQYHLEGQIGDETLIMSGYVTEPVCN